MKLIYSIIKKLKNGEEIEEAHRKVVGMLLEEMMLRDKHEGELYIVQMSLEMYEHINSTYYTTNGKFKFNTYNK